MTRISRISSNTTELIFAAYISAKKFQLFGIFQLTMVNSRCTCLELIPEHTISIEDNIIKRINTLMPVVPHPSNWSDEYIFFSLSNDELMNHIVLERI